MKVIFIHPDLGIGGAERLVVDAAIALKMQNYEVEFITNHFDENHCFQELIEEDFEIHVFGSWIPKHIFGQFHAVLAYFKMFYLTILMYLFLHRPSKSSVYFVDQIPVATFLLRLFNENIIYYCHHPDMLGSSHKTTLKKFYRTPIDYLEFIGTSLADVILVNSKYTAGKVEEVFPKLKQELQVLYPTVSLTYLNNIQQINCNILELYPQLVVYKNRYNFLSINRFHPAKQIELAIEAIGLLQQTLSNSHRVQLIVAGGYDDTSTINVQYFEKLKNIVKEKMIENVTFIRSPSDYLKADLYAISNCILYTPINEHFGIVPLEAMALGKPVIACNSGGPCETIQHNESGYLVEPDPTKFAFYMKQMLNKDMAKAFGSRGREIFKKFSPTNFSNNLLKIIQRFDTLAKKNV